MVGLEREHWKGRIDFLLACIGYCVGAGNVWRFPYLCYTHGGSAFLLPYIILTVLAALPMFFLELAVGQFTSQGPVTAWSMTPLLSGIGWGMVLISAMVCVYYNIIIMYALLYIFLSLVNIGWAVPWASCRNVWNKREVCLETPLPDLDSYTSITDKISHSLGIKNASCVQRVSDELGVGSTISSIQEQFVNDYSSFEGNYSTCNIKYSLPAQQYWKYFILELSDDEHIGSIGSLLGRNAMLLFLAWVVIFVCIIRGPRSIAKVVYFTATYPLGILVVFLIRALSSPGYHEGIDYYAVPTWDKLQDVGAWGAAASQVLYTIGIGFGGLLTFSSYNRFNNNIFRFVNIISGSYSFHPSEKKFTVERLSCCSANTILRDTLIVVTINAGASIFAGFVTFALIGSIAHETNMAVEDLVGTGPELIFVIYPQGLSPLPSPAIWAFLYFLMVLTLGLDSQFGMMETVVVGVSDRFPDTIGRHRIKFVLVCCVVGFLLGMPLTTKGGIYILIFMNDYSASYALMILALIELIMIAWIYGVKNFVRDIELMIGKKHQVFWLYWKSMWLVVTPIILVLMFIMAMVSYEPAKYENKVIPVWAEFIGWLMVLAPILCVVGRALKMLLYKKTGFFDSLKPSKLYCPRHEQDPDGQISYTEVQETTAARQAEPEAIEIQPEMIVPTGYYLNPLHVENEVDGTENTDKKTYLQTGIRNPSFENDTMLDLPPPCPVSPQTLSPQASPIDDKNNDNVFSESN